MMLHVLSLMTLSASLMAQDPPRPTTLAKTRIPIEAAGPGVFEAAASSVSGSERPDWKRRNLARSFDPDRRFQETGGGGGTGEMIGAGLIGGAIGLAAGGLAGYLLGGGGDICGDDACGLVSGFGGAVIGESIGLAFGVHSGNGRRGSFVADMVASLAVAGAGVAALAAIDPDHGGLYALAVTPVVQLGVTIAIERRTRAAGTCPDRRFCAP